MTSFRLMLFMVVMYLVIEGTKHFLPNHMTFGLSINTRFKETKAFWPGGEISWSDVEIACGKG